MLLRITNTLLALIMYNGSYVLDNKIQQGNGIDLHILDNGLHNINCDMVYTLPYSTTIYHSPDIIFLSGDEYKDHHYYVNILVDINCPTTLTIYRDSDLIYSEYLLKSKYLLRKEFGNIDIEIFSHDYWSIKCMNNIHVWTYEDDTNIDVVKYE